MAESGLTVDIDASEIEELLKQFPEYQSIVLGEIEVAMVSSLIMFQELIKGNTPTGVSGDLKKDFKITRPIQRGQSITGQVTSSLAYGFPIEMGRKVGSPISKTGQEAIALWIKRTWSKSPPDKKLKGVAFVVARAITKKGFKKKDGYRMVEQAFDKGSPKAEKLFDNAIQRSVDKIEKKIEAID